jgi:serine/threonine protein phosphatase PrpC
MRAALAGGTKPPGGGQNWIARQDLGFFAVAGPMGRSSKAAEFALNKTAACLANTDLSASSLEPASCSRFRSAVLAADTLWAEQVRASDHDRGLAAGFAGILLSAGFAAVAHLGDCRVYQLRQRGFIRQTTDHRLDDSRHRRIITRAFGMGSNPEVEPWEHNPADVFVLTAGVHELVTDEELLAAILDTAPEHAVRNMLGVASSRGATDHQTVLVVPT